MSPSERSARPVDAVGVVAVLRPPTAGARPHQHCQQDVDQDVASRSQLGSHLKGPRMIGIGRCVATVDSIAIACGRLASRRQLDDADIARLGLGLNKQFNPIFTASANEAEVPISRCSTKGCQRCTGPSLHVSPMMRKKRPDTCRIVPSCATMRLTGQGSTARRESGRTRARGQARALSLLLHGEPRFGQSGCSCAVPDKLGLASPGEKIANELHAVSGDGVGAFVGIFQDACHGPRREQSGRGADATRKRRARTSFPVKERDAADGGSMAGFAPDKRSRSTRMPPEA